MTTLRLSIRGKLLGGSLLTIAVCAVGFLLALGQLGSVKRSSTEMHDRAYVPTVAADAVRYHVEDLALQNANFATLVATYGIAGANAHKGKVAVLTRAVGQDQKAIKKALPKLAAGPPELAPLARRVTTAAREYDAAFAVASVASDADTASSIKALIAATAKLDGAAAQYVTASGKYAERAVANVSAAYEHGRTVVLVALLTAVLVGLLVGLRMAASVRRSVDDITRTLRSLRENDTVALRRGLDAVAAGDLTQPAEPVTAPIVARTSDEIGDVATLVDEIREDTATSMASYNASIGSLGSLIGHVSRSATTLAGASEQMATMSRESGRAVDEIASAVENVAAGAERQARAVSGARELTTRMATAIDRSARTTADTGQAAGVARDMALQGGAAVAEATDAMASVRAASTEATEAIRQLGTKSEQIGGIVDAITGIAEQTNLLALNAAIEAARAGDQGRGFAVVADEVRKLAEESQTAAGSIAELIREIQAETARAVKVVETGADRTDQGTATVEQARAVFEQINDKVEEMTARVEEISASVSELSRTSGDMDGEIGEVAIVSEETSAATEQVAASAEQTAAATQEIVSAADTLAGTAEELSRLVGRFTLTA
ncbi:methyl-accepting chemotaxis protein [Baekduia alba]|uniref:methyl-accepting chemotaxis protein n=1 Tax=Baekduia alba TaxID=2997333 RepID=UPI002340187E|nr:methyl-accepting chemotaxis protein [Baekduia alba]